MKWSLALPTQLLIKVLLILFSSLSDCYVPVSVHGHQSSSELEHAYSRQVQVIAAVTCLNNKMLQLKYSRPDNHCSSKLTLQSSAALLL